MSFGGSFAKLLAAALLVVVSSGWAQEKPQAKKAGSKPEPGLPATLAGFSDSGKFSLYQKEMRLIGIDFTWTPDGKYDSKAKLSFAGQTVDFFTKVTPDATGLWKTLAFKAQGGEGTIERNGAKARFKVGTFDKEVDLLKDAILFDNFGPALHSLLVRKYDRKKGGSQKVALLILPGNMANATIERMDPIERAVNGKDIKFERHLLKIPGVEITIWSDKDSKVVMGEVPSQKAIYIRDGYESLMKPTDTEKGPISKPEFEVRIERNVKVPVRDGIELATDLYFPDRPGKYPVVLIRTPYKKEVSEIEGRYYARRGYVAAIQDVRGRFSSPGVWEPFVNEAKDGYDAIEWLAKQPYSTGKVGMIGASYLGWVQWQALGQNPPHLTCMVPNVAPPDPFFNIPYEYGTFFLWGAIWWADIVEKNATADISGASMRKMIGRDMTADVSTLPVIDIDKKVLGKENVYWRKWIEHSTNDSYWDSANFSDKLANARIPVFHQSGWFDGDGIGSKLNYAAMKRHGHPNQKLILGPWGHTDTSTRTLGETDFGPEALLDLQREYLRWFDCWLKDMDNGVKSEPLVRIFAMGSNKWHTGNTYPLEKTRLDKWYFASAGNANTSKGDGRLTRTPSAGDAPFDAYTYDPADPTPRPELPGADKTLAEKAKAAKDAENEKAKEKSKVEDKNPAKSKDNDKAVAKSDDAKEKKEPSKAESSSQFRRVTEKRRDILVYTTEPFKEAYTFAGPIEAVLHASSSAKDTDWFVRLVEVDAKGDLSTLCEGRFRARFRNSMSKPELLEPGKIYEYHIDCWQTGVTVKKGTRLRVEVASASFPMFSRNLNTGGQNEKETAFVKADQKIFHDSEHPSYIVLPALP